MEKDFTGFKFKDIFKNKRQKKEYFLKKINIDNFPKMKKSLDIFFNDSKKYFDTSYEDKHIIIGKKNKNSKNKKAFISLKDSTNTKIKNKSMNILKRMTLLRASILKASTDSSNKSNIKASKIITEEKKKLFTNADENSLKPGQRFIEDREVENIFNLFEEVRRINKNKISNFVTVKELSEKKKFNNLKYLKESMNVSNKNVINLKKNSSKKLINSADTKKKKSSKKSNILLLSKEHKKEFDTNPINENDFYKTISTGFSNIFKDEINMKTNNQNMDDSNINKLKSSDIKGIKERKKLIEKQNQYIENEMDKVVKNKFSNILALQEKTFMIQNKNNISQSKLNKYLSSRIKRPKNKHLLLQEEYFRPNLEVKIKLNNYQKKLNPDELYDWYQDLHSPGKFEITDECLPTVETIRNPNTMKFCSPLTKKILEDNDYLKQFIPKKSLRKISTDFRNIQNNYNSLSIKGVNLLKLENNIFKKLKGRKIINDFERLMSPTSVKCKDIYSNIDKNIFTQKTKSCFKLFD